MKKIDIAMLLLLLGGLSGCRETSSPVAFSSEESAVAGTTTESSQISETSTSMTSSKENASSSSVPQVSTTTSYTVESPTTESTDSSVIEANAQEPLWSKGKSTALASFMSVWGKSMNQRYQSYRPGQPTDLYGVLLPDSILPAGDWQMVVDNRPMSVVWSEDGLKAEPYQLLSVYSDTEYAQQTGAFDSHVYFFMIYEGQPKVFITQQNQGNTDNYLYFTETENAELRQGFSDIFMTGTTTLIDSLQGVAAMTEGDPSLITDLDSAYEYLKDKNGNNPDYVYSAMDEGTDGYGHYWELKVASQSVQADGGTGTLARVKVYEDGVLRDAVSGDMISE